MKLKKIASLAFAGIMAVSMLAGCSTTGAGDDTTVVPPVDEPSTTNYAALLQEDLEENDVLKLKAGDSSALQSSLETVVGYVGRNSVTGEFINTLTKGTVRFITNSEPISALATADAKLREITKPEIEHFFQASETVRHLSPEAIDNENGNDCLAAYTRNNINTTLLFVVDRGVSDEAAIDLIADDIETGVKGLNTAYDHIDDKGDTYNYEYTASVAVAPCYFDAMHGIGVKFIAVDIVRSIAY